MSTYLQLVQDLALESGTFPASSITTLVGATGRPAKLAGWVKKAWVNIQNQHQDWLWMRTEPAVATLTINTARYLGPGSSPHFGLTRWGSWVEDTADLMPVSLYDNSIGVSDEGVLEQIEYEVWYDKWGRNTHEANRPIEWAISPAGELCLGPKPDAAYKLRFMYQKSPQVLSADADTPEMPTRFHDLITWEAMRLLQTHDGNFNAKQFYMPEMVEMHSHLTREQLPAIGLGGGPIA